MGGDVNPGMDNVYELYDQLSPRNTINTHDEEKKAKGLVSALAKIEYADATNFGLCFLKCRKK